MNGISKDEAIHVIRLGKGKPPHAECSCGWRTKPNTNLLELATAAFDHSAETGHVLRKPKNSDF